MELYRNGVKLGNKSTSGTMDGFKCSSNIKIGQGSVSNLNGSMSMAGMYSRRLSEAEVLQNYHAHKDFHGV